MRFAPLFENDFGAALNDEVLAAFRTSQEDIDASTTRSVFVLMCWRHQPGCTVGDAEKHLRVSCSVRQVCHCYPPNGSHGAKGAGNANEKTPSDGVKMRRPLRDRPLPD
jgi:hypothetical protein